MGYSAFILHNTPYEIDIANPPLQMRLTQNHTARKSKFNPDITPNTYPL